MDSGRRAFLRGALLTSAGRQSEKKRQHPLGPPPPWHKVLPLAEHCPGCAHPCTDACEPQIIRLHPPDHALAGIPYLDFGRGGCTFCQACVEACPLDIDTSVTDRPVPGKAQLNRKTCIAWQDVICMTCSDTCTYDAITTTYQRRAQVNADSCTGCGMCVSTCPVDALTIT